MDKEQVTVSISLDEYNRLKEFEKKYNEPLETKLKGRFKWLEEKNKELEYEVSLLNASHLRFLSLNGQLLIDEFRGIIREASNSFGYINAKKIKEKLKKIEENHSKYFNFESYPTNLQNVKVYLNNSTVVEDAEVMKLQNDLLKTIRNFLIDHLNFKEGYEFNFSVDDLPSLLIDGENNAASDTYLSFLDKDNNKIIESI